MAGETVAASLNGVDLPAGEIAFDPVTGDFEIAFGRVASAAGIVDCARVTARLEVEDRIGQTTATPAEWSWTYRAEPQTIGALRQLSLKGGQYPAWRSGGESLVFAAPIDG